MSLIEAGIAVSYPWQLTQWQRLQQLHAANRLPHALLLAGPAGVGKKRFALALAQSLLCENAETGGACGSCRQCELIKPGSHPDIKGLGLEDKSKQIKIDQVRELVAGFAQTSQQGGYKVAIIAPAEAMNTSAANGLLKSLEEATDNTLLLLISDAPSQLLPTIRSRCQRLDFPVPDEGEALQWLVGQLPADAAAEQLLMESSGRPLTALAMFQQDGLEHRLQLSRDCLALFNQQVSALKVAEKWLDYELGDCLLWLSQKLSAMIAFRQGGRDHLLDQQWLKVASSANVQQLFWLLDEINQLLGHLRRGGNPNHQLALEKILLASYEKIHYQGPI
jgi:DNA polymerase-3 subunit delta'